MIMYRTRGLEITAHEVRRVTEKYVVCIFDHFGLTTERKVSKRSDLSNWHATWDDAHAFLVNEAKNSVAAARSRLSREEVKLDLVTAMKKPEGVE